MSDNAVGIVDRLITAMNSHDAGAVAALFAVDYRSEQPLHPSRGFGGREQALANWTSVFEGVPDFSAARLSSTSADGTVWMEHHWTGTHRDGSPFSMRGVIVAGVDEDRIRWARLYMEPVDGDDADIDRAVQVLYRPPGATGG